MVGIGSDGQSSDREFSHASVISIERLNIRGEEFNCWPCMRLLLLGYLVFLRLCSRRVELNVVRCRKYVCEDWFLICNNLFTAAVIKKWVVVASKAIVVYFWISTARMKS